MLKVTDVKSRLIFLKVVFLFLSPYLFTYLVEHNVTDFMNNQGFSGSLFYITKVYQKLITAGPRELRQSYTVLVDINPAKDAGYRQVVAEDIGSPCYEKGTRNALAQLLDNINEQKPAVIVIDKYFPDSCPHDDSGTKNLKETLQKVSQLTPIVIGRRAVMDEQLNENTGHSEDIKVLKSSQASLTFREAQEPKIFEGVVNIDPDNRKLALKWLVRPDKNSDPEKIATLSFAAVKAYYVTQSELSATKDLGIKKAEDKYPGIKKLFDRDKNPYISFIEPSKFELIPAGNLITPDPAENFSRLRGKIVIIGESGNEDDKHDSVFDRKIPGFILQANYIEAMLDQRYYNSIPWLDYVIGFVVFVAVSYCGKNIQPAWKLAAYLSVILGGVFLLLYLLVALLGFYINPITTSTLAIAIIIMQSGISVFQKKIRSKKQPKRRSGVIE